MFYKKFLPDPSLVPYVDCLFVWERAYSEYLLVQSPPSGFNAMVFNYADPYRAYFQKDKIEEVPLAFASGQFTGNYHLELTGKIGMIGIVFKPTSLHNYFNLMMADMVNNRIDLRDFLGGTGEKLFQNIKNGKSIEVRVSLLEAYLLSFSESVKRKLTIIDEAIDFIDLKKGMVTIEEVLSKYKISRRYLEKKFLEKVGIPPKLYARIRRFSYLSNIVAHHKKIDWQDIVFKNGYHDQSHLVKDFKIFNQMKPSAYHQEHHELIRFIKKK
jgi:AraC-like DNA-binding protein